MLDIINQQGAQVVALQKQIEGLQTMLTLAFKDAPSMVRFSKADLEKAANIDRLQWKQNRDGTVAVTVIRKKDKK